MYQLRIYCILIIVLGISSVGFSQQNYFFTLSTTKASPLGLGGAYTAIEDDIVSASYNPATLSLYQYDKNYRFTLYLNPIAPATVYYERLQNNRQNNQHKDQIVKTLGLLIKSLVFTGKYIDLGLIFNEQILDKNFLLRQRKFFQNSDLWENSYHTFIARIKLADRVSLGASGSYYTKSVDSETKKGVGFSYGILLKPSPKMSVGLAFIDFPRNMPEIRLPLERLVDQTMNIGMTYKATKSTTLSCDLRNLTEDDRKSVREAHFGFEQKIFSLITIRGGYFQERFTDNRTISGGIGLLNSNLFFATDNQFNHSQFVLNYSFVYQKNNNQVYNWHILSLILRI